MIRLTGVPWWFTTERVRWALERNAVPYVFQPVLPVLHGFVLANQARKTRPQLPSNQSLYDKVTQLTAENNNHRNQALESLRYQMPFSSFRRFYFSLPLMIEKIEDGSEKCFYGPLPISRYIDQKYSPGKHSLYPSDQSLIDVIRYEQYFQDHLGPVATVLAHYFYTGDQTLIRDLTYKNGCSFIQRWLYSSLYMIVWKPFLRKGLGNLGKSWSFYLRKRKLPTLSTGDKAAQLIDLLLRDFERAEYLISKKSGGYIAGSRLTAADISFACAVAPVLLLNSSEGYGAEVATLREIHPYLGEFVSFLRDTPAGRFAMNIYAQHRPKKP